MRLLLKPRIRVDPHKKLLLPREEPARAREREKARERREARRGQPRNPTRRVTSEQGETM
jgi:hypothetical protein